jgi:nucleoside-diphosphate-sugar epimerase
LTGITGQLGRELQRTLAPFGRVLALDRTRMDLTNPDAVRSTVRDLRPDIIVNAAAYTAVDRAQAEPDLATQVNTVAPGVLAEEARRIDRCSFTFRRTTSSMASARPRTRRTTRRIRSMFTDGPSWKVSAPSPLPAART